MSSLGKFVSLVLCWLITAGFLLAGCSGSSGEPYDRRSQGQCSGGLVREVDLSAKDFHFPADMPATTSLRKEIDRLKNGRAVPNIKSLVYYGCESYPQDSQLSKLSIFTILKETESNSICSSVRHTLFRRGKDWSSLPSMRGYVLKKPDEQCDDSRDYSSWFSAPDVQLASTAVDLTERAISIAKSDQALPFEIRCLPKVDFFDKLRVSFGFRPQGWEHQLSQGCRSGARKMLSKLDISQITKVDPLHQSNNNLQIWLERSEPLRFSSPWSRDVRMTLDYDRSLGDNVDITEVGLRDGWLSH